MDKVKRIRAKRLGPEQRKQQLIRCAIDAFATHGIGRANHAQVAKLAKVAVPTVFSYYPTREDLVDAVLQEVEDLLLGIIRTEALKKDLTAFQKLFNVLSNYINAIDQDTELIKVFLDWTTSFEQHLSARMQEYLDSLVPLLSEIIKDGKRNNEFPPQVNPVDAALIIFSSASILAQIRFYHVETNIARYVVNLISSALHLDESDQDHLATIASNLK